MNSFNFERFFLPGKKHLIGEKIKYELTFNINDFDEVYLFAWDNEEDLIKWKNTNISDNEYCEIDFENFFDFFITRNNKRIKFMFLNPNPQINNYESAIHNNTNKIMFFSLHGCKIVIDYFINKLDTDENTKLMLIQVASECDNYDANYFVSHIGEIIELKEKYLKTLKSNEEKFKEDSKTYSPTTLEIEYFDDSRFSLTDKFYDAKLYFFEHSCIVSIGNIKIKAVFDPTKELEFDVFDDSLFSENEDFHYGTSLGIASQIIIEDENGEVNAFDPNEFIITFNTSLKNIELLKAHFDTINSFIPLLQDFFQNKINKLVSILMNEPDIVNLTKNFIDEFPASNFLNPDNILYLESFLLVGTHNLGQNLLLSEIHAKTAENLLGNSQNMESINLYNKILVFRKFIFESIEEKIESISFQIVPSEQIFATYVTICNVTIDYFAEKWKGDYGFYFEDTINKSLDEVLIVYCSLETIIHLNDVTIGCFTYYLIKNEKFDNKNYLLCLNSIHSKVKSILDDKKNDSFIKRLKKSKSKSKKYSIDDIDLMNGIEFENFIAELFSQLGYECEITKATGDQGIDVIALKNETRIGIQAKCYSSTVGNSAIQEVAAGKNHYRLDKVIVITNNYFTESAQKLAQTNSVVLWDRNILKEKIIALF